MFTRTAATVAVLPLAFPLALAVTPGTAPAAGAAVPTCHGHVATIVGTDGDDVLVGTPHRDVIVGLGGKDTIQAKGGNDIVCGGEGADKIFGGGGDDQLYGEGDHLYYADAWFLKGDTLEGGPGDDLLDPGWYQHPDHFVDERIPDTISFADSPAGVTVDLAAQSARGEGHDTLVIGDQPLTVAGSNHADSITGRSVADHVIPLGGHDDVSTGGGDDVVEDDGPAAGSSTVHLGSGADLMKTYAGHVKVYGGPGADQFLMFSPVKVVVDGGPGDDAGDVRVASRSVVRGGTGSDAVTLLLAPKSGHVTFHAGTGVLDFGAGKHASATGLDHVFDLDRDANSSGTPHLVFDGTGRADEVRALGMRVTAYLKGGDDSVTTIADRADDVVYGGSGTDFADLGTGHDTCHSVEQGPC